ncbi:MAG: helix-turn-helix domain-containing protein, partial [Caldilineaceae bacterium]|nr:helix-turn-helix domain-containing protein [Caldilineaceae bacterium]
GGAVEEKLTTGEAARLLGVSVGTVRNLIKRGMLPAERMHAQSQYRILRSALEKYAEAYAITLVQVRK